MKNIGNERSGFTLLIILGVVGFLLILLTGIYKVVLLELVDTRGMESYVKSKSAAEAGEEVAMLALKEKGFGYYTDESYDTEGKSLMLTDDVSDGDNFHYNKDVYFGYSIDSKTKSYNGTIKKGGFQVIPLFYTGNTESGRTTQPIFEVLSGEEEDLIWNIIGESGGISGAKGFNQSTSASLKKISEGGTSDYGFTLVETTVKDFLSNDSNDTDQDGDLRIMNYLTIFNIGSADITYKISTNDGESFTKPITTIVSQAKTGEIKQNIQLKIDNSKYFDVLKYSIYEAQ